MEQKNIAEILKDCPKGMELDCILFKDTPVYLDEVITDTNYPIEIKVEYPSKELETFFLNKYGAIYDRTTANCIIFPKGKTTWEGFVPPCKFKDGDVVAVTMIPEGIWTGIFKEYKKTSFESHCCLNTIGDFRSKGFKNHSLIGLRFATQEEKAKLFDAIKDNGYKWNEETKTLEKLIQPKFKVGDVIQDKGGYKVRITNVSIEDEYYGYESLTVNGIGGVSFNRQDGWELAPNKFDITTLKPFDSKVLVRHNKDNKWCASFFSHIDGDFHSHCYKYVTIAGKSYPMCIPYEKNEHLLGTTNDCDEYYKTWEE